ncbi:unnamed protein product [Rhizophagus irregularis]|nr:unnamed protein product [Rhizophagus irregularis]
MLSFFNGANHILVLFLLPIAFDIGGRTAGLAVSFALFSYHTLLGLMKMLYSEKRGLGWIISQLLTISQPFFFPYFFIHSLRFIYTDQTQALLNFYEMFLIYSSPIFTIIEGAATATAIIICRDKVKQLLEQDERIQIYISIISLVNYVISSYILYSLYTTPGMDIYNATLIGSIMTLAVVITVSLAVNNTEYAKPLLPDLSLLFAYNIYCIYMLSLNWKPSVPPQDLQLLINKDNISPNLFQNFDAKAIIDYIRDLKISNGIVISAFYYLNIIIAENQNEEDLMSQKIFNFIISLTTPIIIAVYTHLLLYHYEYLDSGMGMWRWISIIVCWVLYMWYFNVEDELY